MMRFEKRRQRDDESIDRFVDDLESLRQRSDPEESTNRRNFSIASKFIDWVKSDDLRTMLATYYTLSNHNAPTPEEFRQKSREYMLMKPKKYSYSENRNLGGVNHNGRHGTSPEMTWTNVDHVQSAGQLIITWHFKSTNTKPRSVLLKFSNEWTASKVLKKHNFSKNFAHQCLYRSL